MPNDSFSSRDYRQDLSRLPRNWFLQSTVGTTFNTALATIVDTLGTPPATNMATGQWFIEPKNQILQLMPVSTGGAGATYTWGIYGVRKLDAATTITSVQRSFTLLASGTGAAGSKTGISGGLVSNSFNYADTLAVTASSVPSASVRACTASGDAGWLEIDVREYDGIVVVLSCGTATAVNLLESYASL